MDRNVGGLEGGFESRNLAVGWGWGKMSMELDVSGIMMKWRRAYRVADK